MAQEFPTSAKIIYETLSSDTVLMDLIGTYEFKAGETLDSISVVTPGEDLPSLRNVQGIEIVIQDAGATMQQRYYDGIDMVTTWNVFIISWEPSVGGQLQVVTEMILKKFLGAEAVQVVATVDGLGSLVQNKILIKSNMPILES